VLARGVIVLIAIAAVVFGVTRLHDANVCNDAKSQGFAAALGKPVPGGPDGLARRVTDHCRGGSDLSATAVALARGGALTQADGLAREAIRRDPRGYQGWVALAIVRQDQHRPAAQRQAALRALALNPRYGAARQLASPARAGATSGP
jgi:hypothetical protein